jgi:hypothetical protein
MLPGNGFALLVATALLTATAFDAFGFSLVWAIFALTLLATTGVAIHRSLPRKER